MLQDKTLLQTRVDQNDTSPSDNVKAPRAAVPNTTTDCTMRTCEDIHYHGSFCCHPKQHGRERKRTLADHDVIEGGRLGGITTVHTPLVALEQIYDELLLKAINW